MGGTFRLSEERKKLTLRYLQTANPNLHFQTSKSEENLIEKILQEYYVTDDIQNIVKWAKMHVTMNVYQNDYQTREKIIAILGPLGVIYYDRIQIKHIKGYKLFSKLKKKSNENKSRSRDD